MAKDLKSSSKHPQYYSAGKTFADIIKCYSHAYKSFLTNALSWKQ